MVALYFVEVLLHDAWALWNETKAAWLVRGDVRLLSLCAKK